ncbi:MAG: cytochrome c peroxidase [Chryseolinea sp.]
MKTKILAALIAMATLLVSCSLEDQQLKTSYLELPATLDQYGLAVNDQIPTLGRVLFYDNQLSINNSVSCASCHKQSLAFADNARFSKGFENRVTSRNSMPIQNLNAFNSGFFPGNDFIDSSAVNIPRDGGGIIITSGPTLFWDGREHNLRSMVLRPISNHVEMGISDLNKLADKLETVPYYKDLFSKAYGTDEITVERISDALSYFLESISSNKTKFDKSRFGEAQLSALERQGQLLFTDTYDCNACHQVQDPVGYVFAGTFANIGLDPVYADGGLEKVTNNSFDAGKFKIPSLRNVALTAPYMHDGRFASLDSVIEHYSTGLEDNANLDFRLRGNTGAPLRLNISQNDKRAIIAFLNTLTDYTMITDPKFSNPFKAK